MPFEKGNRAAAGRSKGMGRRRLKRALDDALDEGQPTTFDDIANELIWIANQRDDLPTKIRAIIEIRNTTEGRPVAMSESDLNKIVKDIEASWYEILDDRAIETDQHIERMKEAALGQGSSATHSLPMVGMPDKV